MALDELVALRCRAGLHPLRQRLGAHRQRAPGLVPLLGHRGELHRSGQNPFVESFNDKLRDELLGVELFDTLQVHAGKCQHGSVGD